MPQTPQPFLPPVLVRPPPPSEPSDTDEPCPPTDRAPVREPHVGDDVFFALALGPRKGERRPAKIVRVAPDGTVKLVVFTAGGEDGMCYGSCPTLLDAKHGREPGTWDWSP